MDPVLNSLVQSPLVRTLASVPSKTSSYVHGISDNVPPFSRDKVVLRPYSKPALVGGTNCQNGTFRFKLPQLGYVDHLYLKIKMKNFDYNQVIHNFPHPSTATTPYAVTLKRNAQNVLAANYVPAGNTPIVVGTFTSDTAPNESLKKYYRLPWMVNSNQISLTNDRYVTSCSHDISTVSPVIYSLTGAASNSWNVIKCLDNITLRTRNKIIETLPPEVIPFNVMQMPEGLKNFYKQTMVGFAAGNGDNKGVFLDALFENNQPSNNGIKLFDPSQCTVQPYTDYMPTPTGIFNPLIAVAAPTSNDGTLYKEYAENNHAVFMVPLNFSVFSNLSKNLQTRFVEEMEIQINTKNFGSGYNEWTNNINSSDSAYYDMELHVVYRNWHDNIENSIRQANYKPSIPASIYGSNWYAESSKIVDADIPTLSIPLTCRNLTTQICIVVKSSSTSNVLPYSEYQWQKNIYNNHFKYELKGSGKTLWKSDNIDNNGPDALLFELDGKVNHTYASDAYEDYSQVRCVAPKVTQTSVQPSFCKNLSVINFGLQSHDSFYTGGIALQTISNPTIDIQLPLVHPSLIFTVYCRYANIINIDSDTGVITRTLDV